ncbi:MAG: TrmH family RNA methyltransferase [Myxococcota bacterium]|nr:TrmH family RNA methyltransferase [Myxococcota bacterium]
MSDSASEMELSLDVALYDESAYQRDQARHWVAQHAKGETIRALIALLDARHRLSRRRAERILAEIHPPKLRGHLTKTLLDPAAPVRTRKAMGRILTHLALGDEPALAEGLRASSVRVRRACATAAAPTESLVQALFDEDTTVVEQAVYALNVRQDKPSTQRVEAAMQAHETPPAGLVRLLARLSPTSPVLDTLDETGLRAAQDYCQTEDAARRLMTVEPVLGAWAMSRLKPLTDAAFDHPDARVRMAAIRASSPENPRLENALFDADEGVRWMAQQIRGGQFSEDAIHRRLAPSTKPPSPSLQPPYGLRAGDNLPTVQRRHAALAMCQSRFNINLGVAIRSAEAAGLQAVYFVGRSDFMRSPARGADLAIPVEGVEDVAALVRLARLGHYQIVAIQQTAGSVPYHQADYPPQPLFVVGSEDAGMPKALLEAADLVVEIPQFGLIDSLNVATASTVVLFHWRVHCESS